jgi:hypothetical protein
MGLITCFNASMPMNSDLDHNIIIANMEIRLRVRRPRLDQLVYREGSMLSEDPSSASKIYGTHK